MKRNMITLSLIVLCTLFTGVQMSYANGISIKGSSIFVAKNTTIIENNASEITNLQAVSDIQSVKLAVNNDITSEVTKNLNNLRQSGVDVSLEKTPSSIVVTVDNNREDQTDLVEKITKTVFKNPDGTVSVTNRFNPAK